jgi:tetratricopeptide (TPR) repeat protein
VLESALDGMPAPYRDSHPAAGEIHGFLSDLDYRQGNLDRAAEHARKGLEIFRRTPQPDDARLAVALTNLGNVEFKRRNFHGALTAYEQTLALRHRALADGHYLIGSTEGSLAETLFELARYGEAMTHLAEAERVFASGSGHERLTEAWLLTVRGEILVGQKRFGPAIPVLERAVMLFGDGSQYAGDHALAMWVLSRALHKLGKAPDRVRSLATRARAIFAAEAGRAQERDEVAAFLEQLPARPPARASAR